MSTLFRDVHQWELLTALTLLPHHCLSSENRHSNAGLLLRARRVALTALFAADYSVKNKDDSGVWQTALSVVSNDLDYLRSGGEESGVYRRVALADNAHGNQGSDGVSLTQDYLRLCRDIIHPHLPVEVQSTALLQWKGIASVPPTEAAASVPHSELGGGSTCFHVDKLLQLTQSRPRRASWSRAIFHFMRIVSRDGISTVPEEAVSAALTCLARQGKELEARRLAAEYIFGDNRCPLTLGLHKALVETADQLKSVPLCNSLLRHGRRSNTHYPPPAVTKVLRTMQRAGEHRAVVAWWEGVSEDYNNNAASRSDGVQTKSGLLTNLNLCSHVAVSMVRLNPARWVEAIAKEGRDTFLV